MKMQLTEVHKINKESEFGKFIDKQLFLSKNLYNSAVYRIKEFYSQNKSYLNYYDLQKEFQNSDQKDYRALPAKSAQKILLQLFILHFMSPKFEKLNSK